MTDKAEFPTDDDKRRVLRECVRHMKAEGLSGKARDDAAAQFLAGVEAAFGAPIIPEEAERKFVDVLEALALL